MSQSKTEESPPNTQEMAVYDWQANKSLAESNKYMLTNEIGCDVAFMVGESRSVVYAHKFILISRSCAFYAMLHGPMAEQAGEYITIPDIKRETFKQMLEYIYTEDTKVDLKTAPALLYAAHKYILDGLKDKCIRCLEHGICIEKVCYIMRQAYHFEETELKKKCLDFVFHQPKDVLRASSFTDLPEPLVREIMQADELDAKEEIIFEALERWSEMDCMRHELPVTPKNQRRLIGGMIYHVRFPLMTANYFNNTVVKSELLSPDEMRDICDFMAGKITDLKRFKCEARSTGVNQTIHWRFGPVSCIHNDETAISFSANRPVLVEGVMIDGSTYDEETYDVDLSIFDVSNKELARSKTKVSIKKKTPTYKISFHAAPKIDKGYKYTVIVKIQGSHGYYGTSGKSNLPLRGTSATSVNPEGDFTKVLTRTDQVPTILLKPYVPS